MHRQRRPLKILPAGVCLLSPRCTATTSTTFTPLQQEGELSPQTNLGSTASMVGNSINKIGRLRSSMRRPMWGLVCCLGISSLGQGRDALMLRCWGSMDSQLTKCVTTRCSFTKCCSSFAIHKSLVLRAIIECHIFQCVCVHKHVRNVEGCWEWIQSQLCTCFDSGVGALDCCMWEYVT